MAIATPARRRRSRDGRLSGAFWVAAAMLFCTTAAEWCITAWGASFVEDAADVSADAAVSLMVGYFGGVLVGRVAGSRLARRPAAPRLLALALGVAAAGSRSCGRRAAAQALAGLAVIGVGHRQPVPARARRDASRWRRTARSRRAAARSGRRSAAVLLAPLTIGTLADATR